MSHYESNFFRHVLFRDRVFVILVFDLTVKYIENLVKILSLSADIYNYRSAKKVKKKNNLKISGKKNNEKRNLHSVKDIMKYKHFTFE